MEGVRVGADLLPEGGEPLLGLFPVPRVLQHGDLPDPGHHRVVGRLPLLFRHRSSVVSSGGRPAPGGRLRR
ncbi:hypothetical protein ACFQVA_03845 [Actinomadura keratinilytica]